MQDLDKQYRNLVGPQGLMAWAPSSPFFAEKIREYICQDKHRTVNGVAASVRNMPNNMIEPGQFNVFGFTDCTVTNEIFRPGSGPKTRDEGAPRHAGWHHKQRTFYDGYHGALR